MEYQGEEGCWIVSECVCLDPEEYQYGETWVKRMTLAKAKTFFGQTSTQSPQPLHLSVLKVSFAIYSTPFM
jgi:hypothetical protein